MDINEAIAAEFKQGEIEAALMALSIIAFFSLGILTITGAL